MRSVNFENELILISFSNNNVQKIQADITPDVIDYRYQFFDMNFDGFKDLIVSEDNGVNSLSFIYLYDDEKK